MLTDTLSADDVLKKLHSMIDEKFNRKNRGKNVNPHILKAKMTLWAIAGEFMDYDPMLICVLLKELVKRGSVETNIGQKKHTDFGQQDINPFDAYFIPKGELIDEEKFNTYAAVKKELHKK